MERAAFVSRILLVDDHGLSVRHALAVLDDPKHEIRFALSADDAVKVALSWLPDIILVDLNLDGQDGTETIRHIRENWPARVHLPKIFVLTADPSRLDRVESRRLRIDRVLLKPVSGRQLRKCVMDRVHGPVKEADSIGNSAELRQLFRTELDNRLPELDRCMTRLEHGRISGILHQLIASAAITRHAGLESALRALDAKCREGGNSEEIAFLYQAVLQTASRCRSPGSERS